MVEGGENGQRMRLFISFFFQKFSFGDISPIETNIESPPCENVYDIELNNIPITHHNPTADNKDLSA
jgi:hypothetical protein